jgi:hypothetical protein
MSFCLVVDLMVIVTISNQISLMYNLIEIVVTPNINTLPLL